MSGVGNSCPWPGSRLGSLTVDVASHVASTDRSSIWPDGHKVFGVTDVVPIEALPVGERGRIVDFVGPDDWRHRMAELGLREGAVIELIRAGEPCLIGIGLQRLSFRCDPSMMVLVEVERD